MNKRIICVVLSLALVVLSLSSCGKNTGPFSVILETDKAGLELSANESFAQTTRVISTPQIELNNITKDWLLNHNGEMGDDPVYNSFADLDQIWGEHNGKNYIACTFGVRNADKAMNPICYRAALRDSSDPSADKAVRIMVFRNGESTIYAKTGGSEEYAADKDFLSDDVVFEDVRSELTAGETDRYTVVIWLEGEDPDCVNASMGKIQFSMHFEIIDG